MIPTLDAIATDLATLTEQARWAYTHGYWKAGRGLDAERGVDLSESEDDRIDRTPKYDIEVGNHAAKVAYQAAVRAVQRADVLVASLVDGPQPPLIRLSVFSRPDQLALVARNARWRCEHATIPNQKRVNRVRTTIDKAVRGLSKAMGDGVKDKVAHVEAEKCSTCKIRDRAEHTNVDGAKTLRRQGECETCARWRARNNGQTRPAAKLDGDWLNEARAAQARRRARGEDWGAA